MKKINMNEGPPQTICDAPVGRGGSWNKDNVIIFSPNFTSTTIYQIPAAGGKPEAVFPASPEKVAIHPQFLPDGKHFIVQMNVDPRGLYVGKLGDPNVKMIL